MLHLLGRPCCRTPTLSYHLLLRRCPILSLRSSPSCIRTLKHLSTTLSTKKAAYPERLLIYHAGVWKTVFVGWLKITTIILFFSSFFVLAPMFIYAPNEPWWAPVAVIVGGAIPMLFVAYTTSPFVTYVHIRVPPFVRQSRELLHQWSKRMAPDTEIDMTTMRFYGLPHVSRVHLADLRRRTARLRSANLVKVETNLPDVKKRPWWMGRKPDAFYVADQRVKGKSVSVWEDVLVHIGNSDQTLISK